MPGDRKISISGSLSCLPVSYRSISDSIRSLAHLCINLDEPCHYSQETLTHFVQLLKYRTGAKGSGKKLEKTPEEVCEQHE